MEDNLRQVAGEGIGPVVDSLVVARTVHEEGSPGLLLVEADHTQQEA